LIARKSALAKLHRPWFAGGTITVASVQGDKYYLADGAPAFEDGTLDYLNIPALEIGFKHIESIGYDVISERVKTLTGWLLENLTAMKHSNGEPLVRLFGPNSSEGRGGAVTVNFYDKNGKAFDHRFIESEANKVNISLRTGCFCNPGAGEVALGISRVELDVCFTSPGHEDKMTIDDFRLCIDGKSSGRGAHFCGYGHEFQRCAVVPDVCERIIEPFEGIGGKFAKAFWNIEASKLNPHLCNMCENFATEYHGGVELEISMLFVDVRGSTSMAEKTSPEKYSKLINRFYRAATEEFYKSYGFVEKLLGDEVAGFFVPGFAGPEHAKVAVETGKKIMKAMGYGASSKPWIPVGLGVNTGLAYVGSVNSEGGSIEHCHARRLRQHHGAAHLPCSSRGNAHQRCDTSGSETKDRWNGITNFDAEG
jgi:hypothetical protein